MKKILLAIGLMTATLSSMAVGVFNFGFETPSNELTVGKLDYVNFKPFDTRDSAFTTEPHSGTYALKLNNALYNADSSVLYTGANYERSLKFRNLNLQENTSYRVSFWAKGNPTYSTNGGTTNVNTNIRVRLMVGTDNHDIALVTKGNVSNDANFAGNLSNTEWKKFSSIFFYTSDAAQQAAYMAANPDSVAGITLNHFLNLNIYNPGTFYLDDVSVEPSSVKSITFADNIIKIDLGYAYNEAALRLGKDYATATLPVNSVIVTVNGDVVEPEAVELQPKGFFIFLPFDVALTGEDEVIVSFTNPAGTALALQYTDDKRPFNMDANASKDVLNFSNEKADFNPAISELAVFASLYNPPFIKSSYPENNSFELTKLDTIRVTYNTEVESVASGMGAAPTAKLSGPGMPGSGQVLFPLETVNSKTLTFVVPTNLTLSAGDYIVKISNIRTPVGTSAETVGELSYSYGTSAGGQIIKYLDCDSAWKAAGEGNIPAGWLKILGTERRGDTVNVSANNATRTFLTPNCADFKAAYYFCSRGAVPDSTTYTYGMIKKFGLHLTPGKYSVSFNSAYWTPNAEAQNKKFKFAVQDTLTGASIFEDLNVGSAGQFSENRAKAVTTTAAHSYTFVVPTEGDYRIRFSSVATGFDGLLIGNVKMTNIPSVAAIYKNNLSIAFDAAKSVLLAQNDTIIFAGEEKTALAAAVAKYTNWLGTAPSAYDAAVIELNNAAAAMRTHRIAVDAYLTAFSACTTTLAAQGDDALYVGVAKTALIDVITSYTGWAGIRITSEYNAATSVLNNARIAMNTHRAAIDLYLTTYAAANTKLTDSTTVANYSTWSSYLKLQTMFVRYDKTKIDYQNDQQVSAATDSLGSRLSMLNNDIRVGAPNSPIFPLTLPTFNPSIWETGSFDTTTNTMITGQYGFAGWKFSSGINLSGYKYLVVKIGNDNTTNLSLRLFDANNYWGTPAAIDFGTARMVVMDLSNIMKGTSGQKLNPRNIYIAGFWTLGNTPVILSDVYLTNNTDYSKPLPEIPTAIKNVSQVSEDSQVVDVYSIMGVRVRTKVLRNEATIGLPAGLYIVGNKKVMVRSPR